MRKEKNNIVYKYNGWISWGHFFSTDRVANQFKIFLSYEEAREVLKSFEIDNHKKLRHFLKSDSRPNNFPGNPKHTYLNNGWVSWEHFFDIEKIEYLVFEEAKTYVHFQKFKNQREWYDYCKSGKKPTNIPSNPMSVYKDNGWINMGDWLGNFNIRNSDKKYLSYEDARQFVHKLNFGVIQEWYDYCKSGEKPNEIPFNPTTKFW